MARYFFHLYDDLVSVDPEGIQLDSLAHARFVAVHHARFTAAEMIKETGRLDPGHRIDIADEDGVVLDTIYFRDAMKIES